MEGTFAMGDGYNFQELPFPLARQIRQERRSRLQQPLTVGEDQRHYKDAGDTDTYIHVTGA
jgi:hypothetical protein